MATAPDDKSQVEQTNNPPDSHPDKQLSGNNKDPKEINMLAKDMAKEYRRLVCPYCKSFYTDACTLNCGHMLCFPCLSEIQTASESRLCVTCEVQSIPPVEQLRDLVPNQEVNKAVREAILRIGELIYILNAIQPFAYLLSTTMYDITGHSQKFTYFYCFFNS